MDSGEEKRMAMYGEAYTFAEFVEYYKDGAQWYWDQAKPAEATPTEEPAAAKEPPVAEEPPAPAEGEDTPAAVLEHQMAADLARVDSEVSEHGLDYVAALASPVIAPYGVLGEAMLDGGYKEQ